MGYAQIIPWAMSVERWKKMKKMEEDGRRWKMDGRR
jgi:hypothetical protein